MGIVSLGESLIDFTPIVSGGRTTGFEMHPGGSPFNVAVAVARLGHASAFAGRVPTDFFGRVLLDHLRSNGVDTTRVHTGAEATTLALAATGPVAVVVTDGANGSQLYTRDSSITSPAIPSRVVDTVGAGDAFTAGLLVGAADRGGLSRRALEELDDDDWREVLRFASTAA